MEERNSNEMGTETEHAKAERFPNIVLGIILGGLAFVPPLFVIFLLTGGYPAGGGIGTVVAILMPVFIGGTVITALIIQAVTSSSLLRNGNRWAATGVWLVYPTAFVLFFSYAGYVEIRTEIASWADYSSRDLPTTKIHNLLVSPTPGIGLSPFGVDNCDKDCVAVLHSGLVDSIGFPMNSHGGRKREFLGFTVFRYARGAACIEAQANDALFRNTYNLRHRAAQSHILPYLENEHRPQDVVNHRSSLAARSGSERGIKQQLFDLAAKPKIYWHPSYPTLYVARINECVTWSFQEDYEHDIRIDLGRDLMRAYSHCCAIAEIRRIDGKKAEIIARWEGTAGKDSHWHSFSVSEIVAALTGQPIDTNLRASIEPLEDELAKLAQYAENGAYIKHGWFTLAGRIGLATEQEFERRNSQKLNLSERAAENLARILRHYDKSLDTIEKPVMSQWLDEETLDRIQSYEAVLPDNQ